MLGRSGKGSRQELRIIDVDMFRVVRRVPFNPPHADGFPRPQSVRLTGPAPPGAIAI